MGEILSQNEIDALLGALSSGEVTTDFMEPKESKSVKVYDFKHPDRFSKDQTRTLQMMHEHFSRVFSTSLSAFLRTIVDVKLVSVDQLSYDEFIRSIPNPTAITLINFSPLEGNAILEISHSLGFTIIDRLMGGRGLEYKNTREMTEIEFSILDRIVERIFDALKEAWGGVVKLEPEISAREANPQLFLQIYLPSEMVILLTFEITITGNSGTMSLCIPYVVLEPVAQKLNSRSMFSGKAKARTDENRALYYSKLRKVDLDLSVILGQMNLKMKDLLELTEGDVVPLKTRSDDELLVTVGERPKFYGVPGVSRKNKAVRITKVISGTED